MPYRGKSLLPAAADVPGDSPDAEDRRITADLAAWRARLSPERRAELEAGHAARAAERRARWDAEYDATRVANGLRPRGSTAGWTEADHEALAAADHAAFLAELDAIDKADSPPADQPPEDLPLDPAQYPAEDVRFIDQADYVAFKEGAAEYGYTRAEFAAEAAIWLAEGAVVTPEEAEDRAELAEFERESAAEDRDDARFFQEEKEHREFMAAHWKREADRLTAERLRDIAEEPGRKLVRDEWDRQEEADRLERARIDAEIEAEDAARNTAEIVAEGGASATEKS